MKMSNSFHSFGFSSIYLSLNCALNQTKTKINWTQIQTIFNNDTISHTSISLNKTYNIYNIYGHTQNQLIKYVG